jgi:hypothetical protein
MHINSSAALLAVAKKAGFGSIQAFMPGLQMFWDDVSWGTAHSGKQRCRWHWRADAT